LDAFESILVEFLLDFSSKIIQCDFRCAGASEVMSSVDALPGVDRDPRPFPGVRGWYFRRFLLILYQYVEFTVCKSFGVVCWGDVRCRRALSFDFVVYCGRCAG